MAGGISFVSWSGVASCVVGGVFYLIALAKGKEARQLESAHIIERLADLHKLGHLIPLLVAVTGRVWTDKPLECELSQTPAAIAQIVEEQHSLKQVAPGEWIKDVQTVRSSVRECPWALEGGGGGGVRLPMLEARNAIESEVLEVSGDVFREDGRAMVRRAVDHLLGWKLLGTRRVERVLRCGSSVTAVGELARVGHVVADHVPGALQQGGKTVVLRAPPTGGPFILSKRPLPEIVAGLDDASRVCRYIAVAFGAMGVSLVVGKVARGTLALMRQRRLRRRSQAAREARQAAAAASDADVEDASGSAEGRPADLCVVCLETEAGTVFAQCGHMCACVRCATKLARCPICRAKSTAIRVYRT